MMRLMMMIEMMMMMMMMVAHDMVEALMTEGVQ